MPDAVNGDVGNIEIVSAQHSHRKKRKALYAIPNETG
jgi:hypothetical protein